MNVKIRQADIEESLLLTEIEAQCFPPAEAASREDIRQRMQVFLENFFVAEAQGQIVGFINGGTTDMPSLPDELYHDASLHKPEGDYQTVFGLDVLPDFRHQGIAGLLLEHMADMAKKRGKKGVILTCKGHLIPFYESHGFVNHGMADSDHGGAVWYDMKRIF